MQFVARLNDCYFQFQKLANNYNQIVKVVNAHFSNVAIPHQIAMLEQRTRELKALSIEILNLAKQAKDEAEVFFWQKMLEPFDKHGRLDVDTCMENFGSFISPLLITIYHTVI